MHGPRPALPTDALRHMERKPLRRRQGQKGGGLRLHRRPLTAAVMEPGRKVLGYPLAIGMDERLGQGQCLLTPLHGLRRIAETPEHVGGHGQAPDPWCQALAERQSPFYSWISEADTLLQVR